MQAIPGCASGSVRCWDGWRHRNGRTIPTSTSTTTSGAALPPPGTERQLFDLATLIAQDPWERTRPLWSFVIIDGVEGGRGAMVQKMHYTIADGEGAIRLSEQFIDIA